VIDRTTQDVEEVVGEMRQNEIRTRDEMREVREEVNNIRDMLPKVRIHFPLAGLPHIESQLDD
jgi:hypothetical protein